MASPYRRSDPIARRARARSVLLFGVAACAAVVLVVAGATTGLFGLLSRGGGGGGPSSPLNPFHENISAVFASVQYGGGTSDYFPALDGQDLCAHTCPKPPVPAPSNASIIGIYFYFNVTNTASVSEHLNNFTLRTSGGYPELFSLKVLCCSVTGYQEEIQTLFAQPGVTWALAGYAFTNESIPYNGGSGYALYFNATSP
jgi:hypothetical protein